MVGEWRWLQFWLDRSHERSFRPEDHPAAGPIEAFRAEVADAQRQFLDTLTDEDLQRLRTVRGRERPLADTIQHVLSHSTYHCGQVVTLLRQLGQTPPCADSLVFLTGRP